MSRSLFLAGALVALLAMPASAPAACIGDCDSNHVVTVDELILGVDLALGTATSTDCSAAFDRNDDQSRATAERC